MTYYFKTEKLLLDKFNIANKLNLKPEHVKFVNPRPADTVDITMSKVYNTAIDVVMQPGAPYDGQVTIFYNRVNLRSEFGNAKLDASNYVYIKTEATLHEAIGAINDKLGTRFMTDDLVDDEINPTKMVTTVKLQATESSMEYIGSIDVRLYRSTSKKITIDHEPSVIWHYEAERNKLAANLTPLGILQDTYNHDYTPARLLLENLVVSESIPAWPAGMWGMNAANAFLNFQNSPAVILKQVDGLNWQLTAGVTTGISLVNAICIYRGPTADCEIKPYAAISKHLGGIAKPDGYDDITNPANMRYRNVAVLLLDNPVANTKTAKCLALLHYN